MNRRAFLTMTGAALAAQTAPRPNILWISIEDTSPMFGCYGDPLAITPTIDRLASQGTRFTNAYSTIGVCAPSRSAIITSVYASSLGSHNMRSTATPPPEIRCFPEYLRQAGYYCTNNAKTDYNFPVPKAAWDESSAKAHWKKRPDGKPFFAVFNQLITHESKIPARGDAHLKQTRRLSDNERHDPAKVRVPAYYPDTPEVRRDIANTHDLITQVDYEASDFLKEIEQAGLLEDTIVFFWADHGIGMPRSKRWLYDSGTHVPLIVRIPEKFRVNGQGKPGSVDDRLVSLIDLGPTVLNLAGVPVPAHMQGQAFLGPNLKPARKYIYAARDRMDERYDMVRMAFDGRFRYIRNFDSHRPYYQYMNTSEQSPTMREIRRVTDAPPGCQLFKADHKPPEELYETAKDRDEVHNLAKLPQYKPVLERMRREVDHWMRDIRDLGLLPESELERLAKKYGHKAAILKQPENSDLLPKLLAVMEADPSGLLKFLDDRHAAVRARAAVQLGALPAVPAQAATKLTALLQDESPSVRIRAAQALRKSGKEPAATMKVLLAELNGKVEWARLEAALALDELGEEARPALEALRRFIPDDENKYLVRVANHAVNGLTGAHNQVP